MKKILSLIIISFIIINLLNIIGLAATETINNEKTLNKTLEPIWQWAKSGGGTGLDSCKDVTVDKNGNVYVTGLYCNQATFGPFTLESFGGNDIFVAKLDKYGNWLWVVNAGSEGSDDGDGIAVDNNGNVYITGNFYYIAYFGNISLTSVGPYDIFVAKLDTNGNWLWATGAGAWTGESSFGIALDTNGNGYITGVFKWKMSFGEINLTSQGEFDVFVAKIDSYGNWVWANSGGGISDEFVCDIAVDINGDTYITGDFRGDTTFGQVNLTSQGLEDVFIAKLDNNGNWLWAISGRGPSVERGYDIVVDSSRNVYVTGVFWVSITFETITLITQGGTDFYVIKLDTNGNMIWAISAGTSSTEGTWGITLDKNEDPYVSGCFDGTVTFGVSTIISKGYTDVFVAKLNDDGNWQWAVSAGGASKDDGYSLAIEDNGHIYTTGNFELPITFGTTNLISEGFFDFFVAKLNFLPDQPRIDGPSNIKSRTSYEYRFVSTDPENDDISEYAVNWGDGPNETISGPFLSGSPAIKSHTWKSKGTYVIKAKAIDIYGAESDLATFNVNVPRTKTSMKPLFLNLIERFPILKQLLQLLEK